MNNPVMKKMGAMFLAGLLSVSLFAPAVYADDTQPETVISESAIEESAEEGVLTEGTPADESAAGETVVEELASEEDAVMSASETSSSETMTTEMADSEPANPDLAATEPVIAESVASEEANLEYVIPEDVSDEISEETTATEQKVPEAYLNYLAVTAPYVEAADAEVILASIEAEEEPSLVNLVVSCLETGAEITVSGARSEDSLDVYEFSLARPLISAGRSYQIKYIDLTFAAGTVSMDLLAADIDARFGVNKEVETEPDEVFEEPSMTADEVVDEAVGKADESDLDIVVTDGAGNVLTDDSIIEAIESAVETVDEQPASHTNTGKPSSKNPDNTVNSSNPKTPTKASNGNVVVCLDPGHGGNDPGAVGNGLREADLTHKIAAFMKQELETYAGISVYATRSKVSEAFHGTTAQDLEWRTEYAKSVKADLFFSIHINSVANIPTANGVEVYYPNRNLRPDLSDKGQMAALRVLDELTKLGFYNRGAKISSSDYNKYSDGSYQDYLSVIRNSKLRGIPAILVEHGFISSPGDVSKYLNSDAKLKKIGVADATAVAKYFGLKKKSVATLTATVNDSNAKVGLKLVENTNAASMRFAVWSDKNGQDDLRWYDAKKDSSGNWVYTFPLNHYKTEGKYYIDAWAKDSKGANYYVKGTTINVAPSVKGTATISKVDNTNGGFTVTLSGVSAKYGVKEVNVAIWSTNKGQDDLKWYKATKQKNGTYVVNMKISNHKNEWGKYYADTWIRDNAGYYKFAASRNTTLKKKAAPAPAGPVLTASIKGADAKVAVTLKGASGAASMRFAVWSDKGWQDDLRWYEAKKDASGNWIYTFPMSHYKTEGKYYVDAWGRDAKGKNYYVKGTTYNVQPTVSAQVAVTKTDKEKGGFTLTISNPSAKYGLAQIRVGVWSISNGQDDLRWYNAQRQSNGTYTVTVRSADHKGNLGYYYADTWIQDKAGFFKYAKTMKPMVTAYYPIAGKSATTAAKLVKYFKANATYPSHYKNSDAKTIEAFCQLYIEECAAEGIRAEVAFAQAMLETGFLRFGGDVKIGQYNFCGLGATGGGEPGHSFKTVRLGIRAQVQHLKAYATKDSLKNACVDPRFKYISRGCAPYVEELGGKWAPSPTYGQSIRENLIDKILATRA